MRLKSGPFGGSIGASTIGCLVFGGAIVLGVACGTSNASNDGGDAGGGASTACVFDTRVVFDCPGEPLTGTAWQTECRDGVDCANVTPGSDQKDGCTRTTEIKNARASTSTCASLGAVTNPDDAAAPPVLDASTTAPTCAPTADAGAFTSTWHTPRVQKQACTQEQVDSFRQCLDDSATQAHPSSCTRWNKTSSADAACVSCMESNVEDATWGPLVFLPTETILNTPGCMAIAEGALDGSGCAGKLAASEECDRAMCMPNCALGATDPTEYSAELVQETACETAAQTGACTSFSTGAQCASFIAVGDAGTAGEQACLGLPSRSKDAQFEAVVLAFCGP